MPLHPMVSEHHYVWITKTSRLYMTHYLIETDLRIYLLKSCHSTSFSSRIDSSHIITNESH